MRRHLTEVGDLRGTPVSGVGSGQFWVGLEPSAVPAALTALAADYAVAMDPPVATRRMWLDTIDLRLCRRGMALTAVEDPIGGGCMLGSASPTVRPSRPGPTPWAGRACS